MSVKEVEAKEIVVVENDEMIPPLKCKIEKLKRRILNYFHRVKYDHH
jgi:hypothetical protein